MVMMEDFKNFDGANMHVAQTGNRDSSHLLQMEGTNDILNGQDCNPLTGTLLENERSDIRHRIRINKERLDQLLDQNPLADEQEDTKEANDLPFHSGSLRLSIFRDPSPPTPDRVDLNLSDRYDVAFQSFLKHRPLSENLARNFPAYDFSSSSDDEVSEPAPESPLNLSDTESMSTGEPSPGIFGRRHNKLFASSQSNTTDNRPRSLYDSAKPRPPKEHHGGKDKVSDKLNKLMQFRKRSKSARNEDYFRSSYEKSYEPVPPNVTWTNVVAQSNVSKYQPHPPTTHPTHAMPNPKKKRHAPKPPTNIAPYSEASTSPCLKDDTIHCVLQTGGHEDRVANGLNSDDVVSPMSSPSNVNDQLSTNVLATYKIGTPSSIAEGEVTVASPTQCLAPTTNQSHDSQDKDISSTSTESKDITHCMYTFSSGKTNGHSDVTPVPIEKADTPLPTFPNETHISSHVVGDKSSPHQPLITDSSPNSSKLDEIDSNVQVALKTSVPVNDLTTSDALVSLEKQKLAVEELLKESKATESFTTPLSRNVGRELSKFPAKLSESRDLNPSNYYRYSESAINKQPAASLQGTELIVSLIVEDLVAAVETKLSMEDKQFNQSQRPATTQETSNHPDNPESSKPVGDDVTDGLYASQPKELSDIEVSKRPKSHKHRISMDNASSGYSSPGSGDEAPLSPETPISPLTVPSPTSSYYSASLSASSSRVSNLSRELTLSKSPAIDENAAEDDTPMKVESFERQLATSDTPIVTSASVRSVSALPGPVTAAEIAGNAIKISNDGSENQDASTNRVNNDNLAETDNLSDIPIKFRNKPTLKVRSKSEYIPYRSDQPEFIDRASTVSICMVEKPVETGSLSRAQARLYHQKGSRKKALAAGQKSRAFAMRAKLRWPRQRHSYAESSTGDYILDESDHDQSAPSSNLVSHFVSTRDISTYYDGTEYRTMTADEILHSKREEIFNAYKHAPGRRNTELMGGSVRHLPVSTKEFGFMNDIIQEELDSEPTGKVDFDKNKENQPNLVEAAKITSTENTNSIRRQPSEASSSSSGGTRYSSVLHDSTWSVGGDLSNQNRQRKPSLRKRIQSAFSFQNIRKAMSMEKLNEEERSMSHHYLNENGSQYLGSRERSATLQERSVNESTATNHEPLRKAPSISSLISSVRIRKRHSRAKNDKRNRHTIADPESFAKASETATKSKGYHNRPASAVLTSSSKRKPEDVGSPSYFRPIGRVLQMNPAEGTLLVEMVKPSSGPFGFYIARKKESGDFGSVFISRLSDSYPDKMFAGLMRTGDEITEVNGTSVSGLTLDQVYDLILDSDKTLLKLKPTQVHIV